MKKKIYLFIDGSNLYGGQYDLFGTDEYLSFPKFLEEHEFRSSSGIPTCHSRESGNLYQ